MLQLFVVTEIKRGRNYDIINKRDHSDALLPSVDPDTVTGLFPLLKPRFKLIKK